jgi:hypothetical protein
MYRILNRYLFQHKSLPVPGIGTLYLEKTVASIDATTRSAVPPSYYFRFERYFDAPDKEFFSYLSQQENIADYESLRMYTEFAYSLRDRLNHQNKAEWENVGVLRKDPEGNVVFESALPQPFFLQPVPASKIVRADAQHTLLVGDRERTSGEMSSWFSEEPVTGNRLWWLAALVTGIISVLVILFHFSTHGWKIDAVGNQQVLQVEK